MSDAVSTAQDYVTWGLELLAENVCIFDGKRWKKLVNVGQSNLFKIGSKFNFLDNFGQSW